jgi:hypothetical protein
MQDEKQKGPKGLFLPFLLPLQRRGIYQVNYQGKAANNDLQRSCPLRSFAC